MPEKSSEKPESVKEIKKEFTLVSPDEKEDYVKITEARLERNRARALQERREEVRDLAPGLDMDAFDACYGKDYIDQVNALGNLKMCLTGIKMFDANGISPQGLVRLNACLKTGNTAYIDSFSWEIQGVDDLMNTLNLGTDARELVIAMAKDFMVVKRDGMGVYFKDDNGNIIRPN